MKKFTIQETAELTAAKVAVLEANAQLARARDAEVVAASNAREAITSAREGAKRALDGVMVAQTRAAGVEPGRTMLSWLYHKREFRGVLLHVSTGGYPFVRRLNADGELGDTLSLYDGFEVLDEVWEGGAL